MNQDRLDCSLKLVALVLSAWTLAGCSPRVPTGSGYRPVSREMLIQSEYHHPQGGKYGNLSWSFSATEFVIATDGDTLPPGLVDAVSGKPRPAKQINGTWDMKDDVLLISNVRIDQATEIAGVRSAKIFFTGVIRIQMKGTQYVFSLVRNQP